MQERYIPLGNEAYFKRMIDREDISLRLEVALPDDAQCGFVMSEDGIRLCEGEGYNKSISWKKIKEGFAQYVSETQDTEVLIWMNNEGIAVIKEDLRYIACFSGEVDSEYTELYSAFEGDKALWFEPVTETDSEGLNEDTPKYENNATLEDFAKNTKSGLSRKLKDIIYDEDASLSDLPAEFTENIILGPGFSVFVGSDMPAWLKYTGGALEVLGMAAITNSYANGGLENIVTMMDHAEGIPTLMLQVGLFGFADRAIGSVLFGKYLISQGIGVVSKGVDCVSGIINYFRRGKQEL